MSTHGTVSRPHGVGPTALFRETKEVFHKVSSGCSPSKKTPECEATSGRATVAGAVSVGITKQFSCISAFRVYSVSVGLHASLEM